MKVAVVQAPPYLLDAPASVARPIAHIAEASAEQCGLVVFPEAFLAGYPAWLWRLRALDDARLLASLHRRFIESSLDAESGDLNAVQEAAQAGGVTVLIGFNEVARAAGRTTVFNSVATIGPEGSLLNIHRKLMPTGPERMIWGLGDARGLRVVETPIGRICALICWENYMPLARQTLYEQGLDLLIAPTWDHDESWQASMRHIAKEGACWVVSTATSWRDTDIAADVPGRDAWVPESGWICQGQAMVVDPFGRVVASPAPPEQAILYGDIEMTRIGQARRLLEVAGHYARPDVFTLNVNRTAAAPIRFVDQREAAQPT